VSLLDSGTWKFIVASRSLAMMHQRKVIGSGQDTSLWFEPWLDEGRVVDLVGRGDCKMTDYPTWQVSKLIQNNAWHLTVPSPSHTWPLTAKTDIHAQDFDSWKLTGNSSGDFLFRSAWNIATHEGQKFDLCSSIWYPAHCLKMNVCLLRAILDELLTRDKLMQFGIIQANVCSLCRLEPETISHLFFDCNYSKYIWALCKLKLGPGSACQLFVGGS